MKRIDWLQVIFGLGTLVLAGVVPATAPYAIPAGLAAVTHALPQTSALLQRLRKSAPPPVAPNPREKRP